MALQTRTYTQHTSHNSQYAINLTITEESTDVTSNSSLLSWSLFVTTGNAGYSGKINEISCNINGDAVYSETNKTHNFTTYNHTYNIASGTKNVVHNDDGNKTVSLSAIFKAPSGASYSPGNASIDDTFTLTFIPRTSKLNNISIDLNNNIISWNTTKYSSGFVDNLTIYSLNKSFTINSISAISSATLNSAQLQVLYDIIGTATDTTVNAYISTYNNGSLIGTSNVLAAPISLPNYSLNWAVASCTDSINTYDSYKNNSTDLIANLSKPKFQFSAQSSTGSNYGRTIAYLLNNSNVSSPAIVNTYTGQTFALKASDGRTIKDITWVPSNNVIPYKTPTIQCTLTRTSPTASTAVVKLTGTYYDGNGLKNLSNIALLFKYQETNGSLISISTFSITSSTSNHVVSFTATATITGLTYTKGISYVATITDRIGYQAPAVTGSIPQGLPAWNAYRNNNENYFNVNGVFSINDSPLLNFIYPIGSVYLSVNSTSPQTLFGGTWERINGYYLYAGTGGTTAGSNTSGSTKLTAAQSGLRWHTHGASSSYSGANFYIRHGNTSGTDIVAAGTNTSIDEGTGATWANGIYTSSYSHAIDRVNIGGTVSTTIDGNGAIDATEGHTHSVTPFRYELYAWRRTA